MSAPEDDPVWLYAIFEHLPTAVLVTDARGRTQWVNRAFTAMTGFALSDLRGHTPGSLLQGQGTNQDTVRLMRERVQQGRGFKTTVLNYDRDGRARHIALDVQPVGLPGEAPTHFVSFQSEMLEDSESVRLAMTSARQGVWHWDRSRRSLQIDDEFLAMLGMHDPIGGNPSSMSEMVFADDRQAVARWFRRASRSIAADHGITFRVKAPNGQIYWLEARGRGVRTDDRGRFETASGVLRDITQAKASERAMEHLAYFDTLTGLPNRRALDDRLMPALERAARERDHAAILFIDLDGFKQINDLFGHAFGDSVLCTVAQRLQAGVREQDAVSRLSGDEFLVVVNGFAEREAVAGLAQRLIDSVREPIIVHGQELLVGASIGISVFPEDGNDGERLIRLADLAMYEVKQSGRLGYRFFEQVMNDTAAHALQVETRLRQAVKSRTLEIHYQPLIDPRSELAIGAEALVRWHDPAIGRVGPDQFIPVAERLGLIHMLGEWVLESSALLLLEYQESLPPGFAISVNVSPVQLNDPDFLKRVQGVIDRTGVNPSALMLEVTETALMRDPKRARMRLEQLKEMGLGLAIDDFGTGYSSLVALRDLPIDKLKIDRSFVKEIETNERTRAIVEAMIDIGRRLSLRVNAEGVETQQQADILLVSGCNEFQGYLYAKPMLEADLIKKIALDHGYSDVMPPLLTVARRRAAEMAARGASPQASAGVSSMPAATLERGSSEPTEQARPAENVRPRPRPPVPVPSKTPGGGGDFVLFDWPGD